MGVWGESIDKVLNADVPADTPIKLEDGTPNPMIRGQEYLIGKMLHVKLTGGHMMWDSRAANPNNPSKPGAEVPRDCWEVLEVEGEETAQPTPAPVPPKKAEAPTQVKPSVAPVAKGNVGIAISLADGKTEQQFYNDFFKNASLKGDGTMVTKVMGRTLLPELLAGGQLTKDGNGIFHKV